MESFGTNILNEPHSHILVNAKYHPVVGGDVGLLGVGADWCRACIKMTSWAWPSRTQSWMENLLGLLSQVSM